LTPCTFRIRKKRLEKEVEHSAHNVPFATHLARRFLIAQCFFASPLWGGRSGLRYGLPSPPPRADDTFPATDSPVRVNPNLTLTPQIPSPIKTTGMHGATGQMNGGNRATAKPRGHLTVADILGSAMSTGGGRKAPVRKTARNPPQDPSCVCVSLLLPMHGVVRGP
jgi:hypothetical protein